MNIIEITPEQLKIVLQKAVREVLHISQSVQDLSEQCTFKDVLEISGLRKSPLYNKTINRAIPFGNKLIFSHRDLQAWETERIEDIIDNLINDLISIKKTSVNSDDNFEFMEEPGAIEF